ncbi:hypothetical protein ACFCYX_38945 [Streptomyces populi]|nr:hypothetical protein [Streptomyces populi]
MRPEVQTFVADGPNPVLVTDPGPDANEWHQRLFLRAVNGGLVL